MAQQCPFIEKVTIEKVREVYKKKGYAFFTNGDFNLNIFAIRNMHDLNANLFNDCIGIIYKENGEWKIHKGDGTTDAGTIYRTNPMNSAGTAYIVPGQYRGAYMIGPHGKTKYESLRQKKPMKYYRDNDKDKYVDLDPDTIVEEIAYTNIHRAWSAKGSVADKVNNCSGGCVVWRAEANWAKMMELARKSRQIYGNSFTFTLFTSDDFGF